MYDTYIPLLTFAHGEGEAGSKVVPGLAESLPKITDGGKTYTLNLAKGVKYSDGTPVKASDFKSSIERMFKLNSSGTPYYTVIEGRRRLPGKEGRGNLRDRNRRQDRQDRHPPDRTAGRLRGPPGAALRGAGPGRHAGRNRDQDRAAGDRALRDRQRQAGQGLVLRPQPAVGEEQRGADARSPQRPRRQDRGEGHRKPVDPGQRRRAGPHQLDVRHAAARPGRRSEGQIRRHPVPHGARRRPRIHLDEHDPAALRQPQGPPGGQLRDQPAADRTGLRRRTDADPADHPAGRAGLPEARPLPLRHGESQVAAQGSEPLRPRRHLLDRQPRRRKRAKASNRSSTKSAST